MSKGMREQINKVKDWNHFSLNNRNSSEIKEIFKDTPELSQIGSEEQYLEYIDTIFPDSEIKRVVYHQTKLEFDVFKTYLGKLGRGVYFSHRQDLGNYKGIIIKAILNIKNPVTRFEDVLENGNFTKRDVVLDDEIVVRDVNNIHVLGSKQDIEGFKNFVEK